MMLENLLVGIPAALAVVVAIAAIIFRLGVRRGVRKSLVDARRAYDLGKLDGRREERFEGIES